MIIIRNQEKTKRKQIFEKTCVVSIQCFRNITHRKILKLMIVRKLKLGCQEKLT